MVEVVYFALVGALSVCLFWLGYKLIRLRRAMYSLKVRDPAKSHIWHQCDFTDKPTYCNTCLEFCVSGNCCEVCGVCTCAEAPCLSQACKEQLCKPMAVAACAQLPHDWVKGNLPLASQCFRCFAPCGNAPCLADFRCLWCHKTAHEDCVKGAPMEDIPCSLGPHKSLIIPPNCVSLHHDVWSGKKRVVVRELSPPAVDNWQPLVVMANPKSGGKDGELVMNTLRRLLNPVQVVNLLETPPESALEICRLSPHTPFKVLVCGGDGTVGWVLGAIDNSSLHTPPHVGILPLGTGNDLARVLGWGSGYSPDQDISTILTDVEHAYLSLLDRWEVKIEPVKRYLGLPKRSKVLTMNNYLGVGCDAGVALNFHRQRETRPELFTSRLINKAWYLGFGARDAIEQSCKHLQNKMELYLDGHLQKLPELEGVVILNINSWSSGCSVWRDPGHDEDFSPCRMDDQVLEVVGLFSSVHVGKIQVSIAEPLRIGQASSIKIVLSESVPLHVDGEPWQQGPSTITITHKCQAHMLQQIH